MLLVFLLLAAVADDPRLESIRQQRETMSMQKRVGQLLFENAVLIEEKLDREEAKIKAEKPKDVIPKCITSECLEKEKKAE